MEKRYALALAVVAVVIVFGIAVNSETWKDTSRRVVDIGIVIDQNLLDIDAVTSFGTPAAKDWYKPLEHAKRDAFAKLVEDVVDTLLQKRYEIDARIAVLVHERYLPLLPGIYLNHSFADTMGKSGADIAKAAAKFEFRPWLVRPGNEADSLSKIRNVLSQAQGNRPNVPDFLLWFALHKSFNGIPTFASLERLRKAAKNGPDLVVTVEGSESQQSDVSIVGNGIENTTIAWRNDSPSQIVALISKILSSCSMEIQGQECYFRSENGSCGSNETYRPHSQDDDDESKSLYCFNGTFEFPCEHATCQDNCDKAMNETWECSATCGEGRKTIRVENDGARKFFQHCPKGEKCDTKCPLLKPWHYAVIGISCAAIILVIVLIIVFKCCICAKTPDPKQHPRLGNRQSRHGSQYSKFRSQSGSRIHSRSRSRSRSRGRSERKDGSVEPPKYLEVAKESVKLGTKKAPGTYIDLSKEIKGSERFGTRATGTGSGYRELPTPVAPRRKSGYREVE